jgi:hypothetical protein
MAHQRVGVEVGPAAHRDPDRGADLHLLRIDIHDGADALEDAFGERDRVRGAADTLLQHR